MLPERLDLEITRKCKFKCGICSVRSENRDYGEEVPLDALYAKIKEFHDLGGKDVSISGGEPAERGIDFLCDLIVYCKNLNMRVRMYTVGYGFQNYPVVKLIKTAGLDTSYVSLEGNKEKDELYKGVKGSYEIALKAIELFTKLDIEVILHFTPTCINYMDFPHVVNVAKKYNIKEIRLMAFVEQGRGLDNKDVFAMKESQIIDFKELLDMSLIRCPEVKIHYSGKFHDVINDINLCSLKKSRLAVTSEGIFIPSFSLRMEKEDPNPIFNLGDIYQNSLREAWDSKMMINARNSPLGCGMCPQCSNDST